MNVWIPTLGIRPSRNHPPVPVHPAGVALAGRRPGSLGVRHAPPGKALLGEVHAVHLDGPEEGPLALPDLRLAEGTHTSEIKLIQAPAGPTAFFPPPNTNSLQTMQNNNYRFQSCARKLKLSSLGSLPNWFKSLCVYIKHSMLALLLTQKDSLHTWDRTCSGGRFPPQVRKNSSLEKSTSFV